MTYTEVSLSLKSGYKKIVLTQQLVLVLNQNSQKCAYTSFSSTQHAFSDIFVNYLKGDVWNAIVNT